MMGSTRVSRWQTIAVAFSMIASLVVVLPSAPARAATLSVPSQYTTIQAAVGVAQDGDVIEVAPGSYQESISLFDKAVTIRSTGGADVTTITPTGPGALIVALSATDDGNGNIIAVGSLVLDGFTLTGGDRPSSNPAGAVWVSNIYSSMTLLNSRVINNSTASEGGGITNWGTLTIDNSLISGNSAGDDGGGIYNTGVLTITNSTITGNSTSGNGGGIHNEGSSLAIAHALTMDSSTISDNNAGGFGGGLSNVSEATAVVERSLISGNDGVFGAGVWVSGPSVATNDVQLLNSTVSGNLGTGVEADQTTANAYLYFSTVTNNTTGVYGRGTSPNNTVVLARSLVAGNTTDCQGSIGMAAYNLVGVQGAGCVLPSAGSGDQIGSPASPIDPLLGPLSDNGGPTLTHALLSGSPAINAEPQFACLPEDQRGEPRPEPGGTACDIGAFEVQAAPLQNLINATPSGGTVQVPAGTYTETIFVDGGKTLVGGGATAGDVVIDGTGGSGPTVVVAGSAAFENLTITGGSSGSTGGNMLLDTADVTLTDVIVSNGTAQAGANIAAVGGSTLTIVGSTVSGGQAGTSGGGIFVDGSQLEVNGSVIAANSAAIGNGAGVAATNSIVMVDRSTLLNNSAGDGAGRGGAVYGDENSSIDIVDTTLDSNTADYGGGAYAAGTLNVSGSLFASNTATGPDGSTGGGIGGTGTISIVNSTLDGNSSAGNGGAVGIISGVTTLNNVTLTDNAAGARGGAFSGDPGATLRIGNSLSAGNTNIGGGPDCINFIFESIGHNVLEGAPVGCTLQSTDKVVLAAAAPESLTDNGGPTLTRALGDGHPAIDAGGLRLDYQVFDATTLGDWELNGFANSVNGEILLAAPAPFFTVGSAFLVDPVPVAEDFVAQFDFRIDALNTSGADGITFTITDRPNAANGGGGLLGLSNSFNEQTGVRTGAIIGVSVEFDTYQNGTGEGANDINDAQVLDAFNHIGIDIDGNVSSVANNTGSIPQLDSGSPWTARVEYTASTKTLDVYAAPSASGLPATPTVSTVLVDDIATLLNSSVGYVGFTGATGTQNISGFQQVLNFSFDSGPACEAVDQRGVSRPQGSRCDVGAFELEVTPEGTIISELEVNTFEDTTLESGFSVELGAIPSDRLLAGASAIVGAPLGAIELDAPLDAAPLGAIGLDATPLGAIPLGAIPLGAIPLGAIPLGAINLMDLPIDGGWEAVLAGTSLAGRPPQTVTIEEVFDQVPADQLAEVRLAQLDPTSSAFGDVSVGSLLLGTVPISDLDTDGTLLAACDAVTGGPAGSCPANASPLSLELTGSSLAASPLGAIPLGAIPLGAIPLGAIGTEAAPLGAIPLGAIPLGAIPLGAIGDIQSAPLGAIPLGAIGDLAAAPLGAIPLGAIPLGAIPLGAIPLGAIPLGAIPLGAIDANGDDTVGDVCAFLDADASAQSCSDLGLDDSSTLKDYVDAVGTGDLSATPLGAIPLGAIPLGAIPLGAIDITGIPLGAIQLGAIELAGTPLGAIPLGAIPLGAIPFSAVCDAIPSGSSVTCDASLTLADYLAATGSSTLGATPLGAITLEGLPLGAIPLGAIPLGAISVAGVPLGAIPLGAIDLQTSPLGAIQLQDTPLGAIGDTTTLAEALPLGAIPAETPLGAIDDALDGFLLQDVLDHLTIAFLGETGAFGDLTLADVLVGILLSSDFPWEDLPLDQIEVRDIACAASVSDVGEGDGFTAECAPGNVDTLDVGVNFLLESGDLGGVEARVTIPSDWAYLARSAWLDSGSDLFDVEPTTEGTDLVFALPDTGASGGSSIWLRFSVYAGYQLGTGTISASLTGQDSPDLNADSPVITVVDGLEPSSLGAPTGIDDDTLYVGYVDSSTDVDGFSIPSAGEGVRTTVFLSNLDQDIDTFIYRPESAPLSGDGTERAIPLGSTPVSDGIDFGGNSPLEPEVQGDSPLAAPVGDVLADSSTNTGTDGEELTILDGPTTESYTIQVAGFQGASSDRPYTLRVKRTAEAAQPNTCSPRQAPDYTTLSGGGASIDTDTVTLFLTNPTRFDDVYGAGSWNTASAQLANLAARAEVGGQIVDIADIPGVAAAFGTWDLDPCDVSAANDIVGAIQVWIQDNAPESLRHVTIIGADEIVPFARAEDETVVANESTYAGDFGGSPLFSALTTRHYLTDAPYGDFDPIPWVGTKYAYVTDLSVGRLVENATHIAGAIQTYIDNNGVLSPTTAAVASYDFLYDGATLLADRLDLQLGGPVTDRTLMDDPAVVTAATAWTNTDLQSLIDGVPDIISPNSHYDHYRLLPSQENLNETENDLFTIGDLPGDLSDVIIFTMGCHSGLNVDGSIGTAVEDQDWPEVYSALNAIYIGNTGYGYGDSATVALTESIMANLAGNLDGTLTIGQALTQAKQDQFSKAGLYGVYDLKAIEEATLYGLPFWQISVPGGGPTAPADPTAGPTGTDPISGLTAASFSIDPTFEEVTSVNGTYWTVDGETEYLQWRPIQPRTGVDVTKDGLIATGAIFTDLLTRDQDVVDAAFARPMTVSSTQREPEVETPGIVFPTGFTTVGTGNRVNPDPTGPAVEQVQRLNLIPGQFQGDATGSGGTQRLFEEIEGTVFYQPVANIDSIDWTRPYIADVTAAAAGGEVRFQVAASDGDSGISRVVVLVRTGRNVDDTSIWTDVDLVESGGVWTGAATYSNTVAPPLDYFVFAVNGDGVSAISVFKGGYYQASAPPGGGGLPPVTDDEPPVVSIGVPPAPSELFVETGSAVPAPFACSDALSPVTECSAEVTAPDSSVYAVLPGEALPASVLGVYQASVTAVDAKGNSRTDSFEYTVVGVSVVVAPNLLAVNSPVSLTASLLPSSVAAPDSVVLNWGDSTDDLTGGTFGSTLTASHAYTTPGVYTVELTLMYGDLTISDIYEFVVVYDPNGGFVTGGGWIDSPEGAYVPDPSQTGKASFGFVSKYKKGQSTPDGNTTFQFKAADLKFKSTSYDWMVIAGKKAQFKGSGTINGSGNYGFMLTAIDAALTPSTDVDLFRIKIWDKDNNDTAVYDNQLGASDGSDPTTAIGGGSIVIHDGKKK